ncbi:MAG TPA: molybdopterin-dependent oxidoreductase [Acidimicrobiia bacterium]|nr:molybdopterin-dependent oxidoreductase [Acidimicrobiia bacterium]
MNPSSTRAGVAGTVSAGVALGVGELIAGIVDGIPSPVAAVGSWVVDQSPSWVEDFAISLFGTADKLALAIGTIILALVIGWFTGVYTRTLPWLGAAVFIVFAAVGIAAGVGQPFAETPLVYASLLIAAGAGLGTLHTLLGAVGEGEQPTDGVPADQSRRRFVALATAGGAAAVVAGGFGRYLVTRIPASPVIDIPAAGVTVPPPPPGSSIDLPGISPLVTPNETFYRIDTALVVPRIDEQSWSMRIHGMVDREVRLTYDDLLEMDLVEQYVTLACVSNRVGGDLVGNAKWTGVRLTELLDRAGVRQGASQIVGRSVDDWTAGFPTELAFDGREPILAIGMNDEPLPLAHGFPARIIVPGLYGYVSATKWLSDIELTTWEAFDAYWVPRGWAKEGPIKMHSRIDVPRPRAEVVAGTVDVAGVAWAPLEGVDSVEIRVDDGEWMTAEVATPLSSKAWTQWRARPQLTAGNRAIEVRVIDGVGNVQTADREPPRPDGATGHHRVVVTVV